MDYRDREQRLVTLLSTLTAAGKARWARRSIEPEFAYCIAGGDLFLFELSQGDQPYNPSEPPAGITGDCGGIKFLWLEGLPGWDELLTLIHAAPFREGAYTEIYQQASEALITRLESVVDANG
ncbi:MAG: hypothetical protein AAGH88_16600 [Planctomycetota bacterium]